MGRTKYSHEAKNAIMASFVNATKGVIDEYGIDGVSIRKVSSLTGYSSATLYLYFSDIGELITMSLISYLGDYVRDLIATTSEDEEPIDEYHRSWRLFCKHALAHPSVFNNLYFGSRADRLDTIAKKYYELFPNELENATGRLLTMLEQGMLVKRNLVLLESFAFDLGYSEHEIELINELTVAFFHSFLLKAVDNELTEEERTAYTDAFMEGLSFVLGGGSPQAAKDVS